MRIRKQELPEAAKSISSIESLLLEMDISTVIKEYEDDSVSSLSFTMEFKDKSLVVRLPVMVDMIANSMRKDYLTITKKNKFDIQEQAEKIAWAEMEKFVKSVCTMIKLDQMSLQEAFLPFVYDEINMKTFYRMLEEGKIKLLE